MVVVDILQTYQARLKRRAAAHPELYPQYGAKSLHNGANDKGNREALARLIEAVKGKPFSIWDDKQHDIEHQRHNGLCCFNHIIPAGLPIKNGKRHPLYDFQQLILASLEQHRRLYLLKSTNLGATELLLRYLAYLCLRDDTLKNSQMIMITGPRIDLSVDLIRRMKRLFYPQVVFDSKETVLELNHVRIEAYPSHAIAAARGLANVSVILADESDYWNESEEPEVRAVIERYIPKSNPFIALISTPNRPEGLMATIAKEPEDLCQYKRLYMDYRVALGKLFTSEEIEQARRSSPSFEREFCLKFQGQIGNLISQLAIDKATIELGRLYDPDKDYNPSARHCIGIDCAFGGSSNFAITVLQAQNGKIQVLYSQEFSRPDYDSMLHHVIALMKQYHKVYTIRIDAANPEFIASLKAMLGERRDFNEHIAYLKKQNPHTHQ